MSSLIKMRSDPASRNGLRDLVAATGLDHVTMVEVGSYAGESADVFASMPQVDRVVCVDPWRGGFNPGAASSRSDFAAVEAAFDEVARRHGGKIAKFKGTFKEYAATNPLKPDLVYIDGDHAYESVKADILTARSLGSPYVCGHDYDTSSRFGVKRAVDELLGGPDRTYQDSSWSCHVGRRYVPVQLDEFLRRSFVIVTSASAYDVFADRMTRAGFPTVPRMFDGVVLSDRHKALHLNHFALVSMARAMDWPFVAVFESDAVPLWDCAEKLGRRLLSGVPDDATELVLGNQRFVRDGSAFMKKVAGGFGLVKRDELWGSHAVVYMRRGYRSVINRGRRGDIPTDHYLKLSALPFASEVNFFVQGRDPGHLQYGRDEMVDPEYLEDFLDF